MKWKSSANKPTRQRKRTTEEQIKRDNERSDKRWHAGSDAYIRIKQYGRSASK